MVQLYAVNFTHALDDRLSLVAIYSFSIAIRSVLQLIDRRTLYVCTHEQFSALYGIYYHLG